MKGGPQLNRVPPTCTGPPPLCPPSLSSEELYLGWSLARKHKKPIEIQFLQVLEEYFASKRPTLFLKAEIVHFFCLAIIPMVSWCLAPLRKAVSHMCRLCKPVDKCQMCILVGVRNIGTENDSSPIPAVSKDGTLCKEV